MKIKKRLTISNILMLIIPLVLIFGIASAMKEPFMKIYDKKNEEFKLKDPYAYAIQDKLRFEMDKIIHKEDLNDFIVEVQKFLEPKGYNLIVTYDGEIVSSDITDEDNKAISQIGDDVVFKSNSLVLEMNSTCFVKNSFKKDNKVINVIAINSSYVPVRFDMRDEMKNVMFGYIGVVFLISIIIITITNVILSSKIYKKLIKPLELLSYGSEQIKDGNLDFEMNYESDDEFGQVCRDFNDMRLRLKDSVEKQLKFEENRKQLVVGISHDLRTPLTAIKGYVEGLRDGIANTPEKQFKYLNTIYTKACDMDVLVDSLFLFSKLDTGSFPFKFNVMSASDYIKSFYNIAKSEFYGKNIDISFENKCNNLTKIKVDFQEMNRVLFNIVENSIKYNKDILVKIKILLYETDDSIVIEVSDNGKGVLDEELQNLFVSFYRGDTSRTNPSEGSGLGLAIAKRIVEDHGGEISAYNMNGLIIKIILPKVIKAHENK